MVLSGNASLVGFNVLTAGIVAAAVAAVAAVFEQVRLGKDGGGGADSNYAIIISLTLTAPLFLAAILWSVLRAHLWPVEVLQLYNVVNSKPDALYDMAYKCMTARRDYWAVRSHLFWGSRLCILTSEKSVRDVLTNGAVFKRIKLPGDNITSPHSILGSGGLSDTWKRIRAICTPFFEDSQFDRRTLVVQGHIISAVRDAAKRRPQGGIEFFQLINRLVVETHLLVVLGIDGIPAEGQSVKVDAEGNTRCLADVIDDALFVSKDESPTYTSGRFAPALNFITERLCLPPDELGGIEEILVEAKKQGEITTVERLHNIIMYMIALAPSPACFWTAVHVYRDPSILGAIRSDDDEAGFIMLAQCIKETLRMYAPVPIPIIRQVIDSASANQIGGFGGSMALDDGDRIVIPGIIIQNDPELWANPDTYDPDRFASSAPAQEGGSKVSGKTKMYMKRGSGAQPRPKPRQEAAKARFFPFGMGQHTCLGQPYAVWISMMVTETLFDNFDVELSDPEGLMAKPHSYQRIRQHIYTFPKHPLHAKIKPLDDDSDDAKERRARRSTAFAQSMKRMSTMIMRGDSIDEGDEEED